MQKDDVIYRRAAIEAVSKGCEELRGVFDRCEENILTLPPAQPELRWIPCSERLPEEDGKYFITVKYKHVNDSYEDVYAERGEWFEGRWDMFGFEHCGEVEDVIAWMPYELPKPWEGGQP